jgi:hypothetical protein
MWETLGQLTAFAGLVLAVVSFALLGVWILGPVNAAGGSLRAPTRFLLTDFIWLMLQLQMLLAIAVQLLAEAMPRRAFLIALGLLSLPVIVLWAASVSVVSRAGITRPLKRAAVVMVLVPGTLGVMMALPFLLVGAVMCAVSLAQEHDPWPAWSPWWHGPLILVGAVAGVAAAFALRWISFWVLSGPVASSGTPAPQRPTQA